MHNLKPIKKQSISGEVFEQIKENIMRQEWPQGAKLPSENDMARLFGVSRISVRTAIQKLTALGIVETRNGEGTFVKQVSAGMLLNPLIPFLVLEQKDILELLEFRRGIEMLSCELAAQRATSEDIELLVNIAENMRKYCSENDIGRYSMEDFNFHICIARMSKNSVIEQVLYMLKDYIFTHLAEMNKQIGLDFGIDYHMNICEAIKNRDGRAASFYIEESLKQSIKRVKELSSPETD